MIRHDAALQSLHSALVQLGVMKMDHMIQILHNGGMIVEAVQ